LSKPDEETQKAARVEESPNLPIAISPLSGTFAAPNGVKVEPGQQLEFPQFPGKLTVDFAESLVSREVELPEILQSASFKAVRTQAIPIKPPLPKSPAAQRPGTRPQPPALKKVPAPEWSQAQSDAVRQLVRWEHFSSIRAGSLEAAEFGREHIQMGMALPAALPGPGPTQISLVSSPSGIDVHPRPGPQQFWFQINAELIVYGATEPNARLELDGREVPLRPDGTFSFRFALPDGWYPLQIRAVAVDGSDSRSAQLEFSRSTYHQGEVGVSPQSKDLVPPGGALLP
jgi:hypothetical protein